MLLTFKPLMIEWWGLISRVRRLNSWLKAFESSPKDCAFIILHEGKQINITNYVAYEMQNTKFSDQNIWLFGNSIKFQRNSFTACTEFSRSKLHSKRTNSSWTIIKFKAEPISSQKQIFRSNQNSQVDITSPSSAYLLFHVCWPAKLSRHKDTRRRGPPLGDLNLRYFFTQTLRQPITQVLVFLVDLFILSLVLTPYNKKITRYHTSQKVFITLPQ